MQLSQMTIQTMIIRMVMAMMMMLLMMILMIIMMAKPYDYADDNDDETEHPNDTYPQHVFLHRSSNICFCIAPAISLFA